MKIFTKTALFALFVSFFCTNANAQAVTVKVVFATTPTNASASFADLKYNKESVFNLEVDDRQQRSMSVLAYLSGGVAPEDGQTYPGKTFTDGCGNLIKYRAAVAVNAKTNSYDQDREAAGELNWGQIKQLVDADFMIENHGYYHNKDGYYITNGFNEIKNINENTNYINTKLSVLGTSFKPRVWVTPGADQGYNPYAEQLGYLAATSQNVTDGYPTFPQNLYANTDHLADMNSLSASFNVFLRDFTDQWSDQAAIDNYKKYINYLKNASSPTVHKLWRLGTHCYTGTQPFFPNFKSFIDHIETTSNNTIWVTSLQELLEYMEVKRKAVKTESLIDSVLSINLDLKDIPADNLFRDMSLNVSSDAVISSVTVTGADNYSYNNAGLINIFKKKLNAVAKAGELYKFKIEAEYWSAMSGVKTETTSDAGGGLDVGWIDRGDWMDYSLNVPAGSYTLNLRVATPNNGAQLQLRKQDGTVLSTVNLPNTGAYQKWQTVSTTVNLEQGIQTIRVISTAAALWNINWLEFIQNAPPNQLPVADAGVDQTITLPTNFVDLNGNGSDADGIITSYIWTQESGPSQSVGGSPFSASTTFSDLTEGTYTFRLTVRDDSTASSFDEVVVTVSAAVNQQPTVNVDQDQTITLPVNSVELSGSASDEDGTISSYSWSKVSGPLGEVVGSASSPSTTVSSLSEGSYTFRLLVTDNDGATAFDEVVVTVNAAVNASTLADAGVDQTITLPQNSTTLNGSVSDTDGSIASYTWTQLSGPSEASITSGSSISTTISGLTEGSYSFRLTVIDDKGASASDEVVVIVNAAVVVNQPPTVNAGVDQSITLPISIVSLNGSVLDTDGTIASYQWNKVSGPSGETITSPASASTTVNGLMQGSYTFRLTVSDDKGAAAFDEMVVTVNAAPAPSFSLRIEAESYAFMNGVQTQSTQDEGSAVCVTGIGDGEWMDYAVNVPYTGSYTVSFRLATIKGGTKFQLRKADGTVLTTISAPNTGGGQKWQTISTTISLFQGAQTLRIFASKIQGTLNINWWELTLNSGGNIGTLGRQDSGSGFEQEDRSKNSLSIYPIPTHDRFLLNINNVLEGQVKVQILNISGVPQKQFTFYKTSSPFQTTLSIAGLPKGEYILIVIMSEWKESSRLIKL